MKSLHPNFILKSLLLRLFLGASAARVVLKQSKEHVSSDGRDSLTAYALLK